MSRRKPCESDEYSLGFVSSGSIVLMSIEEVTDSTFLRCFLRCCELRELSCDLLVYEREELCDMEGSAMDELLRDLRSIELVSLTDELRFELRVSIVDTCDSLLSCDDEKSDSFCIEAVYNICEVDDSLLLRTLRFLLRPFCELSDEIVDTESLDDESLKRDARESSLDSLEPSVALLMELKL